MRVFIVCLLLVALFAGKSFYIQSYDIFSLYRSQQSCGLPLQRSLWTYSTRTWCMLPCPRPQQHEFLQKWYRYMQYINLGGGHQQWQDNKLIRPHSCISLYEFISSIVKGKRVFLENDRRNSCLISFLFLYEDSGAIPKEKTLKCG